jgi:predicted DNA-binding ribbon-helix-helix protein
LSEEAIDTGPMEWIMRRQVFLLRRMAKRMIRRDPRATMEPNLRGEVMKRHSVDIAGAKTSVSLEDEFWEALKEIANERGTRVNDLLKSIKGGATANLSSTVRLFVLGYFEDQISALQKRTRIT